MPSTPTIPRPPAELPHGLPGLDLRRGGAADSEACFRLAWDSIADLAARLGAPVEWAADEVWPAWQSLYDHLERTAAEWWIAEDPRTGQLVGAARSIERGGLFQLTELHVRPGSQSGGVGRTLLERTFPAGRGKVRSILASPDVRAVALYYSANTIPRHPVLNLYGTPRGLEPSGDLDAVPLRNEPESRQVATGIDRAVLGHDRSEDVEWLIERGSGFLYRRGAFPAGFAFLNNGAIGPVAALDPADLPEILLHVEHTAHAQGMDRVDLFVPAVNEMAVRHLLGRGFRIDPFIVSQMSNRPFGRFDRYIGFSPPYML